jgi:hypothetical protein
MGLFDRFMQERAFALLLAVVAGCNGLCGIDEATERVSETALSSATGLGGAGASGLGGAGASGGIGGSAGTAGYGTTTYCSTIDALFCEDFDRAGGDLANLAGWELPSGPGIALVTDGTPPSSPMSIRFSLPDDSAGSVFDVAIHRADLISDLSNVKMSFYMRLVNRNSPQVPTTVCSLLVAGHSLEMVMDGDMEAPVLDVGWDGNEIELSTSTTSLGTLSVGEWHHMEVDITRSVLTVAMDSVWLENPGSGRTTVATGPLTPPLYPEVYFGVQNDSGGPHGEIDVRFDTVVLIASE